MYNETYDLPFTTDNVFHFENWESLLLAYKGDSKFVARIKCLSLSRHHEFMLAELICDSIKEGSRAEETCQIRSNLQRVLPTLVELRVESRIPRIDEGNRDPLQLQNHAAFIASLVQRERDQMSRNVRWWKPLVARVVVDEAPEIW